MEAQVRGDGCQSSANGDSSSCQRFIGPFMYNTDSARRMHGSILPAAFPLVCQRLVNYSASRDREPRTTLFIIMGASSRSNRSTIRA